MREMLKLCNSRAITCNLCH